MMDEPIEDEPPPEPIDDTYNIIQGDITKDSFFDDSLDDVNLDSLGSINFSKLEDNEDIAEVLKEDLDINPKRKNPANLKTGSLSTGTMLPKSKNNTMISNIMESEDGDMGNTDPNKDKIDALWDAFAEGDDSDYKLMVHRMGPQTLKGVKIAGYLETFYVPVTVPDIIEAIGTKYGGGRYVIKVVDSAGRYAKSKQFEIAGLPKIPDSDPEVSTPAPPPPNQIHTPASPLPSLATSDDDDDDEEEEEKPKVRRFRRNRNPIYDDDDMEDEEDETPGMRRRPLNPRGGFGNFGSLGNNQHQGHQGQSSFGRPNVSDEVDKLKREMETKIDSKIDSLSSKLGQFTTQVSSQITNQQLAKNNSNGLLSPELLHAALPIIGSLLESKGSKDNVMATQFSEVNTRMASLFQTLQETQRMNEKSRDESAEKERRERETTRKEMLEAQQRAEERNREQQRQQEERFQQMMMKMSETLESRFSNEMTSQQKYVMEQQSLREEARAREESAREGSRQREEEFRAKMAQEERQFRALMQQKEDEAKLRYEEMQQKLRQAELQAEREARANELKILEKVKAAEIDKFQLQNDMIQRRMTDNLGTKDYELKMQMAIQEMKTQRESEMQELKGRLALEELSNKQALQLTKLQHEMDSSTKNKKEDPFDKIMEDYMRKRVMIMMARELEGVEMEEDETPSSIKDVLGTVISKGAESLGPLVEAILKGGGLGGAGVGAGNLHIPPNARVVAPGARPPMRPNPTRQPPPQPRNQPPIDDDDEEEEDLMEDMDGMDEMEEEAPQGSGGAFDFSGIDLNNINMNMFNPQMLAEIEKITSYFDYLKDSILAGGSPQEAAAVAQANLLPEIVDYISSVEDSRVVITDLEMLLDGTNPELKPFFLQPAAVEWLNQMISHLKQIHLGPQQTQTSQQNPGGN